MPLPPCWSVVVAASETGVSTKTGICDGSTSTGFNGSTSSCPHSKQEIRWRNSGISITSQQQNMQDCNRHFGTQRYDNVPDAQQWSWHRSGARFQNFARNAKTRSVESAQQYHQTRQKQSSGGRLPLSPTPAPRQAGNTRATCRGVVDKATANPAAHTRMTGKSMLIFGNLASPQKAPNHLVCVAICSTPS